MSNIDKQALREAALEADEALQIMKSDIEVDSGHVDSINAFYSLISPKSVLALLDELEAKDKQIDDLKATAAHSNSGWKEAHEQEARAEAAEKRIAELSASHGKLREAMAGIHNTIRGGGAYTPLEAILNASKRAYEESAAAAGKGE